MTLTFKHTRSKASSQPSHISADATANQQLHLGFLAQSEPEKPIEPLILVPKGKDHHGRDAYLFNVWCGHSGKQYGGLYTLSECNRIKKFFKSPERFDIKQFGRLADEAVNHSRSTNTIKEVKPHE